MGVHLGAQTPPAPPVAPDAANLVTLNFPSVSIDGVIAMYAELTQRTAIRPSNLQGRITLQGNGPLTKDDAIIAIENVMLANGFTILKQGEKFFKVVPIAQAKTEGVRFSAGAEKLATADHLVSRVFQLKYMDSADAQRAIQPMLHPFGLITPFPRTNTVLVIDTAANLIEMGKMIEHFDRPLEAKVKTKFYRLKNGKAKDVAARILELLGTSGGSPPPKPPVPAVPPGAPPPAPAPGGEMTFSEEAVVVGKVTISSDERTNQIILLTREANFPFFDQMIEKLDADTADPLIVRKIPLKYAEAEALSGLLGDVLGQSGATTSTKRNRVSDKKSGTEKGRTPTSAQSPVTAGAGAKAQESDISVYPDTRTNSLIALGIKERVEWVEGFVRDVDVPLAQVLLQGVVAEVTLNRTDSLGVEVIGRGQTGDFRQSALVNTLAANPIDAASVAAGNIPAGVTQGLNYFLSLKNTRLDVIVQALVQNSNVRILQQPLIQTSHNEEAKIVVGERRPIVTGTDTVQSGTTTATTTSGSTVPATTLHSTYEMTDVALELTIKPLINPGGLVVLDILQKVDAVSGFQMIDNNQVPIISRREANSVVSVQDGEMIILGGLISNREDVTKVGVPLLSDIPLLGYLFSSTTKTKVRTELMLLLQPTVLNTPEQASAEALARRKQMDLYNKKTFFEKQSINQQVDKAGRPVSVPAQPADLPTDAKPKVPVEPR